MEYRQKLARQGEIIIICPSFCLKFLFRTKRFEINLLDS